MSRRPARWLALGFAIIAAMGLTAAIWPPYLPSAHGTEADEVDGLVERPD